MIFGNFTAFFGHSSSETHLPKHYGSFGNYGESKSNIKPARQSVRRSQDRHVYTVAVTRYICQQPTHPVLLQYCKSSEEYVLKHANKCLKIAEIVSEDRETVSEDCDIVPADRQIVSEDRELISE